MVADVKPFLVAPPSAVRSEPWEILRGDSWAVLPEYLSEWDFNTDLRIRRAIDADVDAIRAATGLGESDGLLWSVSWKSSDTHVRASAARWIAQQGRVALEAVLLGRLLGTSVEIWTRIALANDRADARAGEPRAAGSVLWEDKVSVRLVGDLSMFPMTVVDFAALGMGSSSWILEIPEDLMSPVMGSLLLLVNSRDKEFVAALESAGAASDRARYLVDALEEALGFELIAAAVARCDEIDRTDWPKASMGATLQALVRRVLDVDASQANRLAGADRGRFRATVEAGLRSCGMGRQL